MTGAWYTSDLFLAAVSAVSGVAGVIVTIIFGYMSLGLRRPLVYQMKTRPVMNTPPGTLSKSSSGAVGSTTQYVSLRVQNRSRSNIDSDDFDEKKPLVFDLQTKIIERLPSDADGGSLDGYKLWTGESKVSIGPALFHPKAEIRLNLRTAAPPSIKVSDDPLTHKVRIVTKQRWQRRRVGIAAVTVALLAATAGFAVGSANSPAPLPDVTLVNALNPDAPPQLKSTPSVLVGPGSFYTNSVAYSTDNQDLVSGDRNGKFYVWNAATKRILHVFEDQQPAGQGIYSVAFSPRGGYFATGDQNGDVYLWSSSFRLINVFTQEQKGGGIRSIAFSDDGDYLAAGDTKGYLYVWNVHSDYLNTARDPSSDGITSLAFNTANNELAAADANGNVYFWGQNNQKPGHSFLKKTLADPSSGGALSVDFDQDNNLAVGNASDDSSVYNIVTQGTNGQDVSYKPISHQTVPRSAGVDAVAFSPNGKYLALGDANGHLYLCADVLSGPPSQKPILQSESSDFSETGMITSVAFSPDGKHLAAGSSTGQLYQWNGDF